MTEKNPAPRRGFPREDGQPLPQRPRNPAEAIEPKRPIEDLREWANEHGVDWRTGE